MRRLAVIGGGAWGSALAAVAARAGAEVVLWARDPDVVAAINQRHENPLFLAGIALDRAIAATGDAAAAIAGAEAALIVVPAQFLRGALTMLAPLMPAGLPLLLCAKGIETGSLMTMSEIAGEILPEAPVAILSGPSFAAEVARGLPTAVTIARGIIEGRGLGDNARAALITRGLAEMIRLGIAKGAEAETFRGLSGLGDLVLTCTAGQSRNYALGLALGRGKSLAETLAGQRSVVEGVATAAAVTGLAARLAIELPIAAAVDGVLH